MTEDRVRVLRVIEYVGPRSWVENIVTRSIHGTKECGRDRFIHAATLGTYPEILSPTPTNAPPWTVKHD